MKLLLPPSLEGRSDEIYQFCRGLKLHEHTFLTSSGSTSSIPKLVVMSNRAIEQNAYWVGKHIGLRRSDVWLRCLPIHHIAGYAISERTRIFGAKILELDPREMRQVTKLYEALQSCSVASMVPLQIHDLVQFGKKCPPSVRCILVGGDACPQELVRKAIDLGYPLLLTYGMTEACPQVATAELTGSREFKVLPCHKVKIKSGRLELTSETLFSGVIDLQQSPTFRPFTDSSLLTHDRCQILRKGKISYLRILGRVGDVRKVRGRLVSLAELRNHVYSYFGTGADIVFEPDQRIGHKVVLKLLPGTESEKIDQLRLAIAPARIDDIRYELERTELGKTKRS